MPFGHICPSCGKIVDAIEHAGAGCGYGARTAADHQPDPHPWKPPTFPQIVGPDRCDICGTGQRHVIHPSVTRPVGELLAVPLDELSDTEVDKLTVVLTAEFNRRQELAALAE